MWKYIQQHLLTKYQFSTMEPEKFNIGEKCTTPKGKSFIVTHVHPTVSWIKMKIGEKDVKLYDIWGFKA